MAKHSCVLDYIWNEVRYKKGFKKYDYEKLKDELYSYVENPTNDINRRNFKLDKI